jgi:hypothetical protein
VAWISAVRPSRQPLRGFRGPANVSIAILPASFCWVMTIEGLDAYIVAPRDPGDLELLIEAVRPNPRPPGC